MSATRLILRDAAKWPLLPDERNSAHPGMRSNGTKMADARRAQLKDQTDISGARALIVEARFYDDIQDALLEGALAELKAAGVGHDVITVPGALEIPAAIAIALDAAESSGKPYDAAIALGCVVRGDTDRKSTRLNF